MTSPTLPRPRVEVDPAVLDQGFAHHDFPLRHDLVSEPLFELDAIAELADSLPDDQVEHNLGNVPEELPDGWSAPRADLTPGDVARGIETNGCWMVLKRVESDPRYSAILDEVLGDIIERVAHREGGATRKEAYIFLSAPNSTTPVHIDPEHNVFLHVRGPKRFVVSDFESPDVAEQAIKRYYGGAHRNLERMPDGARTYDLEPGQGIYLPPHLPHMVKTFDPVSISFSTTFYTKATEDLLNLYSMNARLERLKLPAAPPGRHPASDRAKSMVWRGLRRSSNALRKARS